MKKTSKKIVFFGSGPVAASSLLSLRSYLNIEAVITKSSTFTEMAAIIPGAKIFKADDKENLDGIFSTNQFDSQLAVLIDFGVIVSEKVINSFKLGIVNSHFSLLPE